jgi:hypothetical protein
MFFFIIFFCFTILLKISLPRFRWKVIRVRYSVLVVQWTTFFIETVLSCGIYRRVVR